MTETRRPLIIAGVLGAVLVAVLAFLVFGGGGDETTEALPPPQTSHEQAAGSDTPEADVIVAEEPVRVSARSVRDPFTPVGGTSASGTGTSDSGDAATSSDPPKTRSSKNGSDSSKGSFSGSTTPAADKGSKGSADKGSQQDPKKDVKKTPVPIAPQPLDGGGSTTPDGKAGQPEVTLLKVGPDSADVRVDGQEETLFMSVPGSNGVTYLSPLPGGCAWMAAAGSVDRVTVCEGETVTL